MNKIISKKSILIWLNLIVVVFIVNCSSDSSSGGTVADPDPEVIITGIITDFGSIDVLSHSDSQFVQIEGSNLVSDVNISATDNFEVSLDDSNFSNQIIISEAEANSGSVTFYVRFSPQESAVGSVSGNISIQSTQLTTQTIPLSGIGVSTTPIINVNQTSINFDDTTIMEVSSSISLIVNGDNLETEISLSVTEGFEISLDNSAFTNALQIPIGIANDETTVYLRFTPTVSEMISGTLTLENDLADTVEVSLNGLGLPVIYNYLTFDQEALAFGGGYNQSATQIFNLHTDLSNISQIKMFLQIDCPFTGCDDWDRFANVKVKDPNSGNWYEIARYITPYWTGTQQLERGLEFDVTDFKSLLSGSVELRIYIENWTTKADLITIDFDYLEGEPDFPYYAVSEVLGYHDNSIDGVPYGVSHGFDLDKTVTIPVNAESTHLRTIISGWGHASPNDPNGRPCAEWCFRTHNIAIDGSDLFEHYMGPIGCASNPISNQSPGNWQPDRAGWCPGMEVPVRVDEFVASMAGSTFTFEYDFEDWTSDGLNGSAYYATSTYVVVKSNTMIDSPTIID